MEVPTDSAVPPRPASPRRRARHLALAAGMVALGTAGVLLASLAIRQGEWDSPIASALANASAPAGPIGNSISLAAAVRRARGGETLFLEPGRYSTFMLKGVDFAKAVTLTSRDPRRPAVFTGFKLRNVGGLTLQDVEFEVVAANGMFSYEIADCTNIQLLRINVHGSLDGNPANDKSPIMIRASRHVTIADSDFRELFHGISFLGGENLTFTGNTFRNLRTDGIRGGGSSHLLIRGNVFTEFQPRPKDHPDGIQLWTTNTKAVARDILIDGNVVIRGQGAGIQGIFIRDTFNQFPFAELTIRNNLVLGGLFNGIGIGGSKGALVENNVVAAYPGQKSWIRVGIAEGMRLTGNRASAYVLSPSAQIEQKDNRKISAVRDGGKAVLADWLKQGDNARTVARPLMAVGLQ